MMVGSYSPKLARMCALMLEAVMGLSDSMSDTEKKAFQPQLEADTERAVMDVLKCALSSRLVGHALLPMKSFKIL